MNSKVKSKKMIAGMFVLLMVAVFVVFFTFKSDTLASDEVFNDVDFKSKNADIDGYKIDFENGKEDPLTKLKLSDDEKTAILKALEDSKFEILSDATFADCDYRVNVTLNKRYELYLDSTYKILIFVYEEDNDSNHKYYKFSNDSDLFKLLEEITKETLNK